MEPTIYEVRERAVPDDGMVEREGKPGQLWKMTGIPGETFVAVADGHLLPGMKVIAVPIIRKDRNVTITQPAPIPEPPPE